MVLTTTDIRSGSHEGCRWCRFILSEIVRSPDLLVERLGKTVAVKLKLGLNITNARDRWYHSLHISNADYYLYASEGEFHHFINSALATDTTLTT